MQRISFWVCAALLSAGVVLPAATRAQDNSARLQTIMTRSRELLHNAEKLPPNVQATMMELHRLRSLEILASRLASRKSDFVFDYMGDYDGLTSDFTAAGRGFLGAFQVLTSGLSPDVKAHRFQ